MSLLIILIQNPLIMSNQEIFSTSYLLKNNVKGYLQKFKKVSISSTFKFKSKINNHHAIQELNSHSRRKDDSSHQISSSQRQRVDQEKKITTFRIGHPQFYNNSLNKAQSPKNITSQLWKSRNYLKQFRPIFPQISNKKIINTKLNRISQSSQETKKNETPSINSIQKTSSQKNNKTIQNAFYQKINQQFEDLIRKQILKTQNQAILRQGQIKFDQTQAFFGVTHYKKRFCSTKKKRKKHQYQNGPLRQQSPLQKLFTIQGPEVKSVSLVPASAKSQEMPILKQRFKEKTRYSYQKISQKIQDRVKRKEQPINMVKGWDNQQYSNSSQIFEQKVQSMEKHDNRYKKFKPERFY